MKRSLRSSDEYSMSAKRKTCKKKQRTSVMTTDRRTSKFNTLTSMGTEVYYVEEVQKHRENHGRFGCGQKCVTDREEGRRENEIEEKGDIGSGERK